MSVSVTRHANRIFFAPHVHRLRPVAGFSGKNEFHTNCVFLSSLEPLYETFFLISGRIQQDISTNVLKSSCKVPDIFVQL
jgi:hypothetical protein